MLPRQMPRKRIGPRMYRRDGRAGYWMSFSDKEKHIPLNHDDGRPIEDEADAASAFAQRVRDRQGSASLEAGDVAVAELFAACYRRAQANHTRKTAYEINLDLTRVAEWLEARGIFSARKITSTTVEDYKTSRRFTVGAARINRELTSWKKGMKVAIERRLALPACLGWFTRMREPRPEPHQLKRSKAEIGAFLDASAYWEDHRWLFRTVIGSAIRDDEARHVDEGDVREEEENGRKVYWLVVGPKPPGACSCCPKGWATKGFRYRKIPISEETAHAARMFIRARDAVRINMGNPKYIWSVMQDCCEASGVPAFSLHHLRHAWATQMWEAGHKLGQISKWLGHADVQTTMRYLGVTEEEAPLPESLPW